MKEKEEIYAVKLFAAQLLENEISFRRQTRVNLWRFITKRRLAVALQRLTDEIEEKDEGRKSDIK